MYAIIVCGLGFGDEGKGSVIDSLARLHQSPLVVRYSGGSQAGHNVQMADGRRHTCSQYGAGFLRGAYSYLGPEVIMDLAALERETQSAVSLNPGANMRLFASRYCRLVTPYHRLYTLIKHHLHEHGTCGQGIGAVQELSLAGSDYTLGLYELRGGEHQTALRKISRIQQRLIYLLEKEVDRDSPPDAKNLFRDMQTLPPYEVLSTLRSISGRLSINTISNDLAVASDFAVRPDQTIIFEGSQGILLDQYAGFHPHTTWADVSPNPAISMALSWGIPRENIKVLGVTRAYHTRHGNGPLPGGNDDTWKEIFPGYELGNEPNIQGTMRVTPLQLPLLRYAVNAVKPDYLAVTCVDQLPSARGVEADPYIPDYTYRESSSYRYEFNETPGYTLNDGGVNCYALNNHAQPKVEHTSDLLAKIGEICPIAGTSAHPDFTGKHWRVNINTGASR